MATVIRAQANLKCKARSLHLQNMASSSKLQRFGMTLDRWLLDCTSILAIVAVSGAALCVVQIVRSAMGHLQYEESASPLLIDIAFLIFLACQELRWSLRSAGSSSDQPLRGCTVNWAASGLSAASCFCSY